MSIASKYKSQAKNLNLDKLAVERNQDYENETTWWIFVDGSALGLNSYGDVLLKNKYGRNVDHQQLR